MKKILDLLEQKVQWIVFAAGVAYVLFMAWTYLITSPVKAEIDGEALSPGEIDRKILTTVAEDLQAKMKVASLPTDIPKAEQYVENFKSEMSYGGKKPDLNLNAYVYLNSGMPKLPDELLRLGPGSTPGMSVPSTPIVQGTSAGSADASATLSPSADASTGTGPVEKLPVLAAPALTHTLTGLSLVDPSAPPPPGSPAPENVTGVDKNWVTVRFEIDPDMLAKAWDQAKIPNSAAATCFLQVVLTRQELMPDDSWGNETVIKPLAILNVPPFLGENIATAAKYEFNNWARNHQPEILQPMFYTVLKGDPWYIPGEAPPPVQNQTPNFRPESYLTAGPDELMKLTPAQRRAVAALKAQQQRNRGGVAPIRPAAPAGGVDGVIDQFVPNDPDRPIHYVLQDPIDQIDVIDVIEPPPGSVRVNIATGAGVGKFTIPSSDFDPRRWAAEHTKQPIIGWAHDDTAAPGATYRYKVSYKVKNPVFGNKPQVRDVSLIEDLAIQSPDSVWSSQVDVASTVSFFVAGPPREAAGTIPIEVFRWKGGAPYKKIFQVGVGETIGSVDNDVDYGTGWTVVDFVKNPAANDWVVILMDQRGSIRRRTSEGDRKDTRYQRMKDQVAAGAAAAATP